MMIGIKILSLFVEALTKDPKNGFKEPQYKTTCLFRILTKSFHEAEISIKDNIMKVRHLNLEPSVSNKLPKTFLLNFENFYIKSKKSFTITLLSDLLIAQIMVRDVDTQLDLVDRFSRFGVLTDLPKKYNLDKKIGKGGFGTVYLAKHHDTGNQVAIKVIEKYRIKSDKNYVSHKRRI